MTHQPTGMHRAGNWGGVELGPVSSRSDAAIVIVINGMCCSPLIRDGGMASVRSGRRCKVFVGQGFDG